MDDEFDDFGLPGSSLRFDDFLAEELGSEDDPSTDETTEREPTSDPIVQALDEDRELTVYGAMLVAVTAATDALADKTLTPQADAFRAYLADLRTELYE